MPNRSGADRTVAEVVDRIGGRLLAGDPDAVVLRLSDPDAAGPQDAVFAFTTRAARALMGRELALLVIPAEARDVPASARSGAVVAVADPRLALARASALWAEAPRPPGRHPSAWVDPTAEVHPTARVGAFVVVGARVAVGPRVVLEAGVHLGEDVVVEEDCVLHDHVVVKARCRIGPRCILHPGAVIGADGFGFASSSSTEHVRIEQLGDVVLEADVEVGANTCIDRATLGTTRVGRGAKVDNLVQVGHNVTVGPGCILIAQCGVAGSSRLGAGAIVAAQAGVAGHLSVGAGSRITGQAGVRKDVPPDGQVAGSPAEPKARYFRRLVRLERLEDLWRRVRDLERERESRR